jgi:catechol 2,3-dioxygenase
MPPHGVAPPGFRLPDDTHIGAVRLLVSDLAQSLAYYQNVLGLRVREHTGDGATLSPHNDDRVILALRTSARIKPARRGAFGLYHFAILLPDRAALGRFAAHLSRLALRVGMADHRVSEALYLWDPDGLGIEVYADRPRHEWEQVGDQLVMTTDPLDITDVIASGGSTPWTGMPPGTRIGHVHLHVGDLARAESFYHRGLGFDKTVWDYPGALFLAAGGYHHHLGTNTWSPGPAAADDHARLLDWDLVLPGADAVAGVARSLRAAGFAVDHEASATDPWGTRIRIVSRGQER